MAGFKFVRLADVHHSDAAVMHDKIAIALEDALQGIEATPENTRSVVGGAAALLIALCLEVGIDPLSVFSEGLTKAVIASSRSKV